MMLQHNLASSMLLTFLFLASGSAQNISTDITVAFFPDSEGESCEKLDISDALVLTTNTVPQDYTCFNVSDIFTQSSDTGFQNDTGRVTNPDPDDPIPRGIYWELRNRDAFDSNANYSHVWYEQVNTTGDVKPGKGAPWILWTYAFEDCEQLSEDEPDVHEGENPWFSSSCQTEDGGECQVAPDPIKSFAIAKREHDCVTWALQGDAAKGQGSMSMLGSIAAGVIAYLLV